MAADTRQDSAHSDQPSQPVSPPSIKSKKYERFNNPVSAENANPLPASAANNSGGKPKGVGILDAIASVKLKDFKDIHKKPCARDSLMTGMGAGFAAGGLRTIRGGPVFNACSWAVGVFCISSWVVYEFCNRKRFLEMQAVKRAVDVIDYKKAERRKLGGKAKAKDSQTTQLNQDKTL